MDSRFWKERWEKGEIGFHLAEPHSRLIRHAHWLPPGKVMVPLCGKSPDLLYLRAAGHEVVGAELSEIACQAFFEENGIAYAVEERGSHRVYRASPPTGGLEIWCGDFFELPAEAWSGVRSAYDRAALVALPPELGRRYADALTEGLRREAGGGGRMLLITLEHDSVEPPGPPFSIDEARVRELYELAFSVRREETGPAEIRGQPARESVYLLSAR